MQLQPTPTFVSVPEFAARTSLSVRQVWRLIGKQQLPAIHIGRRRLVKFDEGVRALEHLASEERERDATLSTTKGNER